MTDKDMQTTKATIDPKTNIQNLQNIIILFLSIMTRKKIIFYQLNN